MDQRLFDLEQRVSELKEQASSIPLRLAASSSSVLPTLGDGDFPDVDCCTCAEREQSGAVSACGICSQATSEYQVALSHGKACIIGGGSGIVFKILTHVSGCTWESDEFECQNFSGLNKWVLVLGITSTLTLDLGAFGKIVYERKETWNCLACNEMRIVRDNNLPSELDGLACRVCVCAVEAGKIIFPSCLSSTCPNGVPKQWTLTVSGALTADACGDCDQFIGTFTLTFNTFNCEWVSDDPVTCCDRQTLFLDRDIWKLVMCDGTWELPTSTFDCLGNNTLTNVESTNNACNNWPASVSVNAVI